MIAIRSTPLRLTATLIVIFAAFTLAGYGAAFFVIRATLDRDVEADLAQAVDSLRAIAEPEEISERVAEIAAGANPRDTLIGFAVPGSAMVGNLPKPIAVRSGAIVGHRQLSLDEDTIADSYRAWHGPAGGGDLTVLMGRDSVSNLGGTFSTVLLLSLVPALVLATTAGALVARSARNRVEAIGRTLAQLTSGRNDARVPVARAVSDDLGQIATAINRMAEAQERSVDALRQVSSDIAHDLRTPIQRVAVLLDRLEGAVPAGPATELVTSARKETAQIVETFGSLLQIAQLEGGQARAGFSLVDLGPLVGDLVDVYGPAGEETGHSLIAEIDGRAVVRGDRTLLGRLIANLIENALRHTARGRITIEVSGGAAPTLSVRDEGPGIPTGEREHVLRRLYRLERSRTSEGSGLGLSLVKAIAEIHCARLQLGDARPGLAVTVIFPPPAA
ncbi:MAG: HAMP domain-containing sensor histidine kinase [Amaricoccus sp.]